MAEDRPELVNFGDLTPDHFRRHPVWINCHTADYEEVWYGETDEETFRPFLGALPAGPEHGMLLVHADLTLADGTRLDGFVTPASQDDPSASDSILGLIQPQLFLPSGRREWFWGGMLGRSADDRKAFYAALGKTPDAVFPITFAPKPGLAGGIASGSIEGFYSISRSLFRGRKTIVER